MSKKPVVKLTNRQFAKEDKGFIDACVKADIPPTIRQASKYRRKIGTAFNTK